MRIIDLSHTIIHGEVTYPGLPAPRTAPFLDRESSRSHYAEGTEFQLDTITMVGNTGTYLDAPFTRYEGGKDLADLPLETLVGLPAHVFHVASGHSRRIDVDVFQGRDNLSGSAVLVNFGWDQHFGTDRYGVDAPFLTAAACQYLVEHQVALVGVDSVNIDDTQGGGERPAHSLLLAADIHIVEHLKNLSALPETGALFTAVPPKVRNFGTFPVRAFAQVQE
jgi:kynurenine formamidase